MCHVCDERAHAANTPNTQGLYRIGGRQITLISASQYSYGEAREPGRNVDLQSRIEEGGGGGERFLSHFLRGVNRSNRGKWKVFFVYIYIYVCMWFLSGEFVKEGFARKTVGKRRERLNGVCSI